MRRWRRSTEAGAGTGPTPAPAAALRHSAADRCPFAAARGRPANPVAGGPCPRTRSGSAPTSPARRSSSSRSGPPGTCARSPATSPGSCCPGPHRLGSAAARVRARRLVTRPAGEPRDRSRRPRPLVDQLDLEPPEEALRDRVVPAVAATAHAAGDSLLLEGPAVVVARVLLPRSEWWIRSRTPGRFASAQRSASSTSSRVIRSLMAKPTTRREKRSRITAR
jgi:hypothetical protein